MRHKRNFVFFVKVFLIQFFPAALSVIFLLVYAKCNFVSVFMSCFFFREKVFVSSRSNLNFLISCFALFPFFFKEKPFPLSSNYVV